MLKEERDAKREEIRRQTEEFLKAGGEIVKLQMGDSAEVTQDSTPLRE